MTFIDLTASEGERDRAAFQGAAADAEKLMIQMPKHYRPYDGAVDNQRLASEAFEASAFEQARGLDALGPSRGK